MAGARRYPRTPSGPRAGTTADQHWSPRIASRSKPELQRYHTVTCERPGLRPSDEKWRPRGGAPVPRPRQARSRKARLQPGNAIGTLRWSVPQVGKCTARKVLDDRGFLRRASGKRAWRDVFPGFSRIRSPTSPCDGPGVTITPADSDDLRGPAAASPSASRRALARTVPSDDFDPRRSVCPR